MRKVLSLFVLSADYEVFKQIGNPVFALLVSSASRCLAGPEPWARSCVPEFHIVGIFPTTASFPACIPVLFRRDVSAFAPSDTSDSSMDLRRSPWLFQSGFGS